MIAEHRHRLGTTALCNALGEPRSSWHRSQHPKPPTTTRRRSRRKLGDDEERKTLDLLHSERFVDTAPAEVHATLLDEGVYLCSERTMYRLLERTSETKQRRQSLPRAFARPELIATRPNQVWSWDITKLKGPAKWTYYYLYTIIDIFSRYIVGWMIAYRERAFLAEDLFAESCLRQSIVPGQLTIHGDRGKTMTARTLAQLFVDLGITKTHSRPYVSNDNPFSESNFKTLKYRPDYPEFFPSIDAAREYSHCFFTWYNHDHRHSGVCMLTPEIVHYGLANDVLRARQDVLTNAFERNPNRFVRGVSKVDPLPAAVYINPPNSSLLVPTIVS
jgi:putative transposase